MTSNKILVEQASQERQVEQEKIVKDFIKTSLDAIELAKDQIRENEKAIDFHVDNVERVKEGKYKIKKNYDRLEVYVTMDRV